MFTKIGLTNFKSWTETGDVRCAPLTGFFGGNSSGKSSLLQMLLLLKQTVESLDSAIPLNTGSQQAGYVNLGTVQEMAHSGADRLTLRLGWKPQDAVQIQSSNSQPLALDEFEFDTTIEVELDKVKVREFSYRSGSDLQIVMALKDNNHYQIRITKSGIEEERPRVRPRIYIKPVKCYGFSNEALQFYNQDYVSKVVASFESNFNSLYYLGPLREYPQREYRWGGETPSHVGLKGESAIVALLAAQSVKKKAYSGKGNQPTVDARVAQWLVELGLATSFTVERLAPGQPLYRVLLRQRDGGPDVALADMGIGISQILPVLTLCYYVPEGSTLILEHPELHLHPSAQSGLADVFIDVIKNRRLQIIVESHSEHLLRRLQRRIAEGGVAGDDAALYFCRLEQGISTIRPLEIDAGGNILNWPPQFFGDLLGDMFEMAQAGIRRKYPS